MAAWRMFAAGVAVGLIAATLLAGGAGAELFARATAGGGYLLDARFDESAIGRALHVPAATLGEVSVVRRSWIVLTVYAFTLTLRPELSGTDAAALRGLQVSVRLPGAVTATNATRVAAGTAVWEAIPAGALTLRTRAVHWLRVIALLLLAVVAVAPSRRR